MRNVFSFVLALVAVASLAGCKSACRQLTELQCSCLKTSTERTNCLTVASSKESNTALSAEDNATCQALLDGCDCRLIDTAEGKVRCGLARPFGEVDAGL